jgi:zinc protease
MSKRTQAKESLVPASFTHVCSYKGIEEYELKKNGLRVLYQYNDTAPVAGLMVTYLVGSRYEATGHTGATHILEHMMFKGSKKFPQKNGQSALETFSKKGALVNASTWVDRTNYYEVLPKEHIELAIQLEADRMRHANITKKDLQHELPAVLSEYAMSTENDPVAQLEEKMWAVAFLAHPYHHSTIGWLSDIQNIPVEKLQEFYDTYYQPNNAVVTIVGDVERKKALTLIDTYFGVHKKTKDSIPRPYTKEPVQRGKRFVEVKRAGTKNVVGVAFKVPEALHTDTPSLLALSDILGGGKTSRLYKGLVETQLASKVWTSYMPFYDPSLMELCAYPNDGVTHEDIEKAILKECELLVNKGVTKIELAHTVAGVATELAFARDGLYSMLSVLNEAIAAGDWRFFFDLPEKFSALTEKDVHATAKRILERDSMTVGYYRAEQ